MGNLVEIRVAACLHLTHVLRLRYPQAIPSDDTPGVSGNLHDATRNEKVISSMSCLLKTPCLRLTAKTYEGRTRVLPLVVERVLQ